MSAERTLFYLKCIDQNCFEYQEITILSNHDDQKNMYHIVYTQIWSLKKPLRTLLRLKYKNHQISFNVNAATYTMSHDSCPLDNIQIREQDQSAVVNLNEATDVLQCQKIWVSGFIMFWQFLMNLMIIFGFNNLKMFTLTDTLTLCY